MKNNNINNDDQDDDDDNNDTIIFNKNHRHHKQAIVHGFESATFRSINGSTELHHQSPDIGNYPNNDNKYLNSIVKLVRLLYV